MTHRYADRVMVLSTSLGSGDLVLGQAVAGYQDFAMAGFAIGDTCDVCIEDPVARVWEVTRATLIAADSISRGELFDSSAGGARISFAEGIKRIYIVQPGAVVAEDKLATESARDQVEGLIAGFGESVAGATQGALGLIESTKDGLLEGAAAAGAAAGGAAGETAGAQSGASAGAGAAAPYASAASLAAFLAAESAAAANRSATAASVASVIYATTAEGLAAVAEGGVFSVAGTGPDYAILYRKVSGSAVELARYPSADALAAANSALKQEPQYTARSFIIADQEGNTALEISGNGASLGVAGASLARNVDGAVGLSRLDGVGGTVTLINDGVRLGDTEHAAAPEGVDWAVADYLGFAAIAVMKDGRVKINGLTVTIGPNGQAVIQKADGGRFYDSGSGISGLTFEEADRDDLSVGWADEDGFIGQYTAPGRTAVTGLTFEMVDRPDLSVCWADDNGYIGQYVAPDGVLVAPGIGGGSDPDAGEYSASEIAERNVRNLCLSMQVKGVSNDAVQRPTAGRCIFLGYGQSLSTGTEGWPALTKAQPFAGLLTLGTSMHASGGASTWTPFGDTNLHQLRATVRNVAGGTLLTDEEVAALAPGAANLGETPIEAALVAFRRAWNNARAVEDDSEHTFVAGACGVGGTTVAEISKGTGVYGRLTQFVNGVKAAPGGTTYCVPGVIYLQGENDYADGTAKATVKAQMAQLRADIQTDIAAGLTGQSRPLAWFMYQTNGQYTRDDQNLAVGMAQFELMQEQDNWFLVAPSYAVTNKNGGHLDANGYRWMGEYFGKVMKRVFIDRQGWKPLHPVALTRRGREVLIDFHVPEPPLVWDTPYNSNTAVDYPTKGFLALDEAGTNAISSIEIVSDTVVRITLARDVVGALHLRYAGLASFNGNGCLRDSDPYRATSSYEYLPGSGMYASANIAALVGKPYPLHNWCLAFDIPVSQEG